MPGAEPMVNMKLVIIGDGGCGKSALLMTYIDKKFPDDYIPTVVDNYDVVLSLGTGRKLKLSVVDTAGQEEFKSIRALSYSNTHVVIICYSCNSRTSLDNVKSTWVKEIRIADKDTPFVLVGNKLDLAKPGDKKTVTAEEAEKVCEELDGYAAIQCSAKAQSKGKNGRVEEVFKVAIRCGVDRLKLFDDGFCNDVCGDMRCEIM